MKAVVLEVHGNTAAVMKSDGTIEKINRACKVGEEIIINDKPNIMSMPKRYMAIAASLALVIILGGGGLVYAAPASYVTMDANLSFEFALNVFDEVVSMEALTDEGKQIADEYNSLSSFHPTLDEAITLTSELLYNSNYLDNTNTNNVIISAVSNNDEKSLMLSETAKNALTEVGGRYGSTTDIATTIASAEDRIAAKNNNQSKGQYIKDNGTDTKNIYTSDKHGAADINASISSNSNSFATAASDGVDNIQVNTGDDNTVITTPKTDEPARSSDKTNDSKNPVIVDKDKKAPVISDHEKNAPALDIDDDNDYITPAVTQASISIE